MGEWRARVLDREGAAERMHDRERGRKMAIEAERGREKSKRKGKHEWDILQREWLIQRNNT